MPYVMNYSKELDKWINTSRQSGCAVIETSPGQIRCLHPTNGRRRYNATPADIGWAQA